VQVVTSALEEDLECLSNLYDYSKRVFRCKVSRDGPAESTAKQRNIRGHARQSHAEQGEVRAVAVDEDSPAGKELNARS
jgi:hypothetical protein